MPLPSELRVRISSEAAGSIAMTGVAVRSLPIRDLIEQALGAAGKDAARVREILKRGSLVAGESRLRWEGIDADDESIRAVLATFPDPDPACPFDPEQCFHAQLSTGALHLDVSRDLARRRRLFRKRSFWDALMSLRPEYAHYSYKLRCDVYRVMLDGQSLRQIHDATVWLRSRALAEQIRAMSCDRIDLFVRRPGS